MRKLTDQFRKLHGKSRLIISICLFGLVASLASVAFVLEEIIGISVFAISGRLGGDSLGYDDLADALTHGMAWHLAALPLAEKLVSTIISYGLMLRERAGEISSTSPI
jgi:hypothetical protein